MSIFGNIPSAARSASHGGKKKKRSHGVPTVGRRGSGAVRLTNRVRHNIKRRSTRKAHRYYKPQIRADRQALKQVRSQRRTELQSVTGAVDQASSAISTAEKNAKQSGLKGRYLHDVVQELSARQADLPASAALLQGDIRQQYQSQIQSARQAIGSDRVNQSQKAQELFASALSKAQTQAHSTIAKRQSGKSTPKEQAQKQRQRLKDIKVAVQVAKNMIQAYPGQEPSNGKEWARFEHTLAGNESVDPVTARIAVRIIRRRDRKKVNALEGPVSASVQANVLGG